MAGEYVDIYLLPVPEENLDQYRDQASTFGKVVMERGGLSYREFKNDDAGEGMGATDGAVLIAAVAEFDSREHRDEVMGAVMEDPRIKALIDAEQVADMSQMRYGGFVTFVDASS